MGEGVNMGSLRSVFTYTHHVTPTYNRYNLLGILHVANKLRTAIIQSVQVYGYTYAVELLTNKNIHDLAQDLMNAIQMEREVILKTDGKNYESTDGFDFTCGSLFNANLVCDYVKYLASRGSSTLAISESVIETLFTEMKHDKRSSKGSSPSLILAPELGKYTTSRIPYEGDRYPNVKDSSNFSMCLLLALIGWACCSFKWGIVEEGGRHHIFAYVAPKDGLRYIEAKILYLIGRRLAYMTSFFSKTSRRSYEARGELSTIGILALLSPVIRDVAESVETLSKLELNIYTHSFEGRGHSIRIAGAFGLDRVNVRLLPSRFVGVMLAEASALPKLAFEIPSFFNILGEYLVSENDVLYVEALRELVSALNNENISPTTKRLAELLLRNAVR